MFKSGKVSVLIEILICMGWPLRITDRLEANPGPIPAGQIH